MTSHINTREPSALTLDEMACRNLFQSLDTLFKGVTTDDAKAVIGSQIFVWIREAIHSQLEYFEAKERKPINQMQRIKRSIFELAASVARRADTAPYIPTDGSPVLEGDVEGLEAYTVNLLQDVQAHLSQLWRPVPGYTGSFETLLTDAWHDQGSWDAEIAKADCRDRFSSVEETRAEQRRDLHVVE
jgi:hypothetical protein